MPLPPLTNGRLTLHPFAGGDLDPYHLVWGDPEVIWWGASPDRAESAIRLESLMERAAALPEGMGWSWLVHDGTIVGDVILQPAPEPPGGIEIGWHLAREHWGRGYATEGAALLLPHAWSLGLDEVIATILPVNLPSVRVAERLGMRRRGPTVERLGLAHRVWVIERPGRRPPTR